MVPLIGQRERSRLLYIGYKYKVFYRDSRGVPFYKYFRTKKDIEEYTKQVIECNGLLVKVSKV